MREVASRSWRPFGYWALTINAAAGFPGIVTLAILYPDSQILGVVAGAYVPVLAAWAAAAAIRQHGKNNGTET